MNKLTVSAASWYQQQVDEGHIADDRHLRHLRGVFDNAKFKLRRLGRSNSEHFSPEEAFALEKAGLIVINDTDRKRLEQGSDLLMSIS